MTRIEKFFIGILLGSIFPIFLFLAGWWSTYKNPSTFYYALAGLVAGLIIDILFLKRWIPKAYEIPVWQLICIYLFYTVGIYGFFMGFPVFNLLMGIVAGYYFRKRIRYKKIALPDRPGLIHHVSLFTGLVMTLICISSAWLALMETTIGLQLQHMLGLPFEVTWGMVWGLILVGGTFLVLGQYFLTKVTLTQGISKNSASV